ncbi:hypothetical protein FOCC_FOCC012966 [Frankliniella occidentalis]|nr:hypothetical protein FOCC_FOCC012966 [Frankliniella occidentalis]
MTSSSDNDSADTLDEESEEEETMTKHSSKPTDSCKKRVSKNEKSSKKRKREPSRIEDCDSDSDSSLPENKKHKTEDRKYKKTTKKSRRNSSSSSDESEPKKKKTSKTNKESSSDNSDSDSESSAEDSDNLDSLNSNTSNLTCSNIKKNVPHKIMKLFITKHSGYHGPYKTCIATLKDNKSQLIKVKMPKPVADMSKQLQKKILEKIKKQKNPRFMVTGIHKKRKPSGKGHYETYDYKFLWN